MRVLLAGLALFLFSISCSASDTDTLPFTDLIYEKCGLHPRVQLLRDAKSQLLDAQIGKSLIECVTANVDAQVLQWDLTDIELQGCLIEKYGYTEEYVNELASSFRTFNSTNDVDSQIEPYNQCVNNLRICGERYCDVGESGSVERTRSWLVVLGTVVGTVAVALVANAESGGSGEGGVLDDPIETGVPLRIPVP